MPVIVSTGREAKIHLGNAVPIPIEATGVHIYGVHASHFHFCQDRGGDRPT